MISVPTIAQIRAQIIADIEARIGQTIPAMPKAFFRVLATALAGVLYLVYRFGVWIYEQIFPQTASEEALTLIGEQYGLVRTVSVAAILTASATGTSGTIIPEGTLWNAGDIVYQQTADAEIILGAATVIIEALTTGDDTNQTNGTFVSLVTPISGVNTNGTIASTVITGEDAEDIELYRARILQRLQQRPQGGSIQDYVAWALEVPGIVKAFAFNTDAGEVTVLPLIALSGTRIPDLPKLAEVEAYVADTRRRPLCANVVTAAMIEKTIDVTVTSLTVNDADTRLAIQTAWENYLLKCFPLQYPDEAHPTNVVSISNFYVEAMGAGARAITLNPLYIEGYGAFSEYTLAYNEIAKLGTITWP